MLPDKPADQIEQIVPKTETVLQEADPDFEHLVEITSYYVGLRDQLNALKRARSKSFGDPLSAWRAIEVASFVREGAFVEIGCTARGSRGALMNTAVVQNDYAVGATRLSRSATGCSAPREVPEGSASLDGAPTGRLQATHRLYVMVSLFGRPPGQPYDARALDCGDAQMILHTFEHACGVTEWRRTLTAADSDQLAVARPDRNQGGVFDGACRALGQVPVPHAKAAHGSESRRY